MLTKVGQAMRVNMIMFWSIFIICTYMCVCLYVLLSLQHIYMSRYMHTHTYIHTEKMFNIFVVKIHQVISFLLMYRIYRHNEENISCFIMLMRWYVFPCSCYVYAHYKTKFRCMKRCRYSLYIWLFCNMRGIQINV